MTLFKEFERLEKSWGKTHLKIESNTLIILDNNGSQLATLPLQNKRRDGLCTTLLWIIAHDESSHYSCFFHCHAYVYDLPCYEDRRVAGKPNYCSGKMAQSASSLHYSIPLPSYRTLSPVCINQYITDY